MLSGECRIDAIPVNGQAVLIDGLRLRLDLRLAPSAATAKASPLPQRTSSALLPRRIQRLAAVAGLAALLGALALWFAGGTAAPPAPHALPAASPPPALVAPAVAAPPPVEVAAPPAAPVLPEVHPIVVPPARLEAPTTSRDKPALPVAKSPAPSRPLPQKPPVARPPATDREMLDLFGDTK